MRLKSRCSRKGRIREGDESGDFIVHPEGGGAWEMIGEEGRFEKEALSLRRCKREAGQE